MDHLANSTSELRQGGKETGMWAKLKPQSHVAQILDHYSCEKFVLLSDGLQMKKIRLTLT